MAAGSDIRESLTTRRARITPGQAGLPDEPHLITATVKLVLARHSLLGERDRRKDIAQEQGPN